GNLAVHDALGADDAATEGSADGLVAKADAEQRDAAGKMFDGGHRDARLIGRAGARRDHDVARRHGFDAGEIDLVVADHAHVGAQFPEVLHEVPGEGIVVVDHQQHQKDPDSASLTAWNMARALFMVSSHSARGTESATTPAPAWM